MAFLHRAIGGFRALFRRRRVEGELDAELRAYLDAAIEERMRAGMSRHEATRAARAEIGSLEAVKDHTRDAGWESRLETLWQDIRYAGRTLRNARGFTAVAVLTLALGIGANTAIFSIVNAMLIDPLTDDVRMRLVRVYYTQAAPAPQTARMAPSLPTFADWRRANRVFDGMVLQRWAQSLTLLDSDPVERVRATATMPQLFALFGASPIQGRLFTEQDSMEPVAVISYGAWQRRFGGDPAIVGRTVRMLEGDRTIVGVLPPELRFPQAVDFWIPFTLAPTRVGRAGWSGELIARLKPGVTLEQARLDMTAVARQLGPDSTALRDYSDVGVESLHESAVASARPMLLLLLGATGFILLLACVNVAGLLVARGVNRNRELAVRAALGAGRLRIARQLLTESMALAVLGGIAGALLARWTLDALIPMLPVSVPSELAPSVDLRVLGFTLVVSIATGLLFGLLPAVRMSRPSFLMNLKDGNHGTLRWASKTGTTLVVVQTALALVLLTGAGLMVRSLQNVLAIDPGFDASRVLVIEATPVIGLDERVPQRVTAFYEDLIARVSQLPGVEAVGAIDILPFWADAMRGIEIDGPEPVQVDLRVRHATRGYFQAMGIGLVAGRSFTAADRSGSSCVAIVNQHAARQHWPGSDALGGRVRRSRQSDWCEIVGVVNDVRHGGFEYESQAELFFSALQPVGLTPDLTVVARAANPAALVAAARAQTADLSERALVEQVVPFNSIVDRQVETRRHRAVSLSVLSALGILLATLGIFGIASYAVARKTSEIGIRIALGATHARVLRTVIGTFAPAVAGGVLLGLLGSAAVTRLLANAMRSDSVGPGPDAIVSPLADKPGILYGVAPNDPLTFGILSALLMLVGLAACYLPARRATKIDPLVALRHE